MDAQEKPVTFLRWSWAAVRWLVTVAHQLLVCGLAVTLLQWWVKTGCISDDQFVGMMALCFWGCASVVTMAGEERKRRAWGNRTPPKLWHVFRRLRAAR